jgi:hypothetical protein
LKKNILLDLLMNKRKIEKEIKRREGENNTPQNP